MRMNNHRRYVLLPFALIRVEQRSLFLIFTALLLASGWDTDPFTREIVYDVTLDNFRRIIETPVFRDVAGRTIQLAALVTSADAVLAVALAY